MHEIVLLVLSGLLVGFLVGLTGVGGGALMTPILILGFNTHPVIAIATDLLFAAITKLATIPLHSKRGSVDWGSARMMWAGSIPGAVIGTLLVITVLQTSLDFLGFILAFVLSVASASMFMFRDFELRTKRAPVTSALGGGFIGLSVATTSVGAGALGMAVLRATMGGVHVRKLVGTDIVHSIPLVVVSATAYASLGFVETGLLLTLLAGSIPGALFGAISTGRINSTALRVILGIMLAISACGIFLKALGN